MDLGTKNANSLLSKDVKAAHKAAMDVINSKDIETFLKLCEKSEFIFDFIKEKIVNNFLSAVTNNNFENLFEFSKIFSYDFGDIIIKSWLKFANEDLTDKILELFETGTVEQKAYAAAYFTNINDSLAIEYLNKYALDEYEPLSSNCACALRAFGDTILYNQALSIVGDNNVDDFDKSKYINFLISYADKNAFDTIYNSMLNSIMEENTASSLLCLLSFDEIIQKDSQKAKKILDIVLGAYPETISLSTLIDFNILDTLKYLTIESDSYSKRLLLKAKHKFNIIASNDIYTFDLDKNTKNYINKINNFLNTINLDTNNLECEFKVNDTKRVVEAFNIVQEIGLTQYLDDIVETIFQTGNECIICEGIKTLKSLNKLGCVDKQAVLDKIHDKNIEAIIQSYFG